MDAHTWRRCCGQPYWRPPCGMMGRLAPCHSTHALPLSAGSALPICHACACRAPRLCLMVTRLLDGGGPLMAPWPERLPTSSSAGTLRVQICHAHARLYGPLVCKGLFLHTGGQTRQEHLGFLRALARCSAELAHGAQEAGHEAGAAPGAGVPAAQGSRVAVPARPCLPGEYPGRGRLVRCTTAHLIWLLTMTHAAPISTWS